MNLPIKPGTARRLGIRRPYAAYPQRWMLSDMRPYPDEILRHRLSDPLPGLVTFTNLEGETRTYGGSP